MFVEGGLEIKAPEYTKAGFVAWLRQQPANKTYFYYDSRNCLNAQFHDACGIRYNVYRALGWRFWRLENQIERIARPCWWESNIQTFGAALRRAEAKGW